MTELQSYRNFFAMALGLHVLLAVFLLWDKSTDKPAMELNAKNTHQSEMHPPVETIQAESVDSADVMKAVNDLKQQREHAAKVEQQHQNALRAAADAARRQRVQEQKRVDALKAQAAQLALQQKKRALEEQQHLAELKKQKVLEHEKLVALQKQQQQLQEKVRQETLKKTALLAKQKELEAKARADNAAKEAKKAQLAGVVDQYKARIIHAIGQQWILPEHVDNRLSSQFRIKLGPGGTVLEVSLMRSSGDAVLDRSAQSAIYKASPLPVPQDPELFNVFRDISLTVRPENSQG